MKSAAVEAARIPTSKTRPITIPEGADLDCIGRLYPLPPGCYGGRTTLPPAYPSTWNPSLRSPGKTATIVLVVDSFPNHRWMRSGTPYSGDRNPGIERSGDWLLL